MRKFLLSFIVILTTLAAQGQIVNIPDANFKNALLNHNPVINTNLDGEIQVSEAIAFTGTINVQVRNIADLTGIQAFVNIQGINCTANKLTSLTLNSFPALRQLVCESNLLTTLQLTNLPLLNYLNCGSNQFISLTVSNLPALATFSLRNTFSITSLTLSDLPALTVIIFQANYSATSLTMNNLPALKKLDCDGNRITSLSFSHPGVLDSLICSNNKLTSLPAGMNAIRHLHCSNNLITSLSLDNMNNLVTLNCHGNLCTAFSINNKPSLKTIECSDNKISSLTISNLPALANLNCNKNLLSSLSVSGFPSLLGIACSENLLTSINLSNLPSLKALGCSNNQFTSLSFANYLSLESLQCDANPLTSFTINNLPALKLLYVGYNNLTTLSINNFPSLEHFSCIYSRLTSLSMVNFPALQSVYCTGNKITSLTLKNLPLLDRVDCAGNIFSSLALDSLPTLNTLFCGQNDSLTSLSLNLPALTRLTCDSTKLTVMDLSQTRVTWLYAFKNPLLQYINLKNGAINGFNSVIHIYSVNSLQFVCVDSSELSFVNNTITTQLPGQNVSVSSFCNYIPYGNYNTITGTVRYDGNANGCNNLDSAINNLKMNIDDGVQTGATFTNAQGNYTFFAGLNPNIINPYITNPWFFSVPPSQTISFINYGNTRVADFCVTTNGIHPDLDITLIPVGRARPGFDAKYKLVYRNKGNQINSGTVFLLFDKNKLNLISSSPPAIQQPPGTLSWPFVGLAPFETRVINLTFNVNAPPVVQSGDTLSFIATIYHIAGDETPEDNKFDLHQIVVNSIDPNDKLVTEGSQISIDKLGEYLHYVVRFQNTGTAEAIRVIVKDSLSANLDWNSFEPIIASHPYRAVISKGNLVEFIFDGINLPPKIVNEPASNGFVSFKIKPKSNLAIGNSIQNEASIFFDFNLPIITNTVTTTIYKPGNNNVAGITVYSNPTKDYLSFSVKPGVEIKGINIFNSMGQKMNVKITESTATNRKIDVSNFANGVYFLELISNLGRVSQKVMIVK